MYTSIQEMIREVCAKKIDEAIVPMENSIEGAVNATMDMLASEADIKIKAELVIPVEENLLVKKGSSVENIKVIVSHPQALGQCSKYITANFPGADLKAANSTASAAEEAALGNGEIAAIGSSAAALVYGLDIAARGIQDLDNNFTRFVVAALTDSERTGNDKSSIVFSTEDKPGSLYRVLEIFSLWDINLCRIESRPAKNQLGKYIFFVDMEGHRDEDDVKYALAMVKRKSSFYNFLGSYPVCGLDKGKILDNNLRA